MDSQLLLNNVEIFNGKDARTFSGNLLIRNNRIETISAAPIETPSERPVTVIDGKGRFLMPGLIDAHWHAYLCCNTMTDLLAGDPSYTHLMAGRRPCNGDSPPSATPEVPSSDSNGPSTAGRSGARASIRAEP